MTSFLKCTGAAKDQSTVVFLHQAQEQLVGDDGKYYSKFGFNDLRQKPTKCSISSYAQRQFIAGQASRLLKNNRHPTKSLSQTPRSIEIKLPVNETGEQRVAHIRYKEGLSIPLERMFWAGVTSQVSAKHSNLDKAKAKSRQGSRRAKVTPRMAKTMN